MTTQHTLSFSSQTPTHFSTNWCYSWHRWSFSHLHWSKTTYHCQQVARLIYTLAALWAGKSELVTLFSSQVGRQQKAIQHSKDKKHPLNMIRNPPTSYCMGRRAEQLWPGLYQETTNNTFFKLRMCHILHMSVWWHNTESLVQHPLSVCLCLVIKNPLTSDSSLYNGCLFSTTVISMTSITSAKNSLNEASLVPVFRIFLVTSTLHLLQIKLSPHCCPLRATKARKEGAPHLMVNEPVCPHSELP